MRRIFFDRFGIRLWVVVLAALLGFAVCSGGGGLLLDKQSCASEAHGLSLEYRWGPLMGCLLRTPGGQYIPDGQYFINHPQP